MIHLFRKIAEVALLIVLLGSCSNDKTTSIGIIAGSYAARYEGEFSKGRDTLVIQSVNENAYAIERRSVFQKIKDGVWLPPQQDIAHWTAVYDSNDHALHEQRQGILLYLTEEGITWGNQHYLKCK